MDEIIAKITDFVKYFEMDVISPAEIRTLAEKSVKFGFALQQVSEICWIQYE